MPSLLLCPLYGSFFSSVLAVFVWIPVGLLFTQACVWGVIFSVSINAWHSPLLKKHATVQTLEVLEDAYFTSFSGVTFAFGIGIK